MPYSCGLHLGIGPYRSLEWALCCEFPEPPLGGGQILAQGVRVAEPWEKIIGKAVKKLYESKDDVRTLSWNIGQVAGPLFSGIGALALAYPQEKSPLLVIGAMLGFAFGKQFSQWAEKKYNQGISKIFDSSH